MSGLISFIVFGKPETKGSAKAFVPKSWAAEAAKRGVAPRAVVTNDNEKAKGWQNKISDAVVTAMARSNTQAFPDGPVVLEVWFYFPRPKTLLSKKWAGVDVPHVTKPDADKCIRVIKDALSKVLYRDDSQVTDVCVHKRYVAAGEAPRAEITVQPGAVVQIPKREPPSALPTLFDREVQGEV